MRVVVVGSKGTLGMALSQSWNDPRVNARISANLGVEWNKPDDSVVPLNLPDFDLCSRMLAVNTIGDFRPDVIVNAAGVNLIDWLEKHPNTAYNLHCHGASNLRSAARRTGALLVQFSCGEVFYRQRLAGPDEEPDAGSIRVDALGFSESDEPDPKSVYAQTKLESERVASEAPKSLILRFSSLFGDTSEYSSGNLIDSLLNSLSRTKKLSVLNDRMMEPLWSIDILCALKTLLAADARGLYHLTGNSRATHKEVAEYFFKQCGFRDREVVGITGQDYGQTAPQSAFTVLRSEKYDALENVYKIPDWKTAIGDFLDWRQSYANF